MNSLLDDFPAPKRVLPIIFIVETSSEMQGAMIGAVNIAISETLPMFLDFEQENNVDVKINVLSYSTGAKWMYGEMINASDFEYRDLIANGNVEMGAAFEALDEALSCGIIGDPFAIYLPYFILFSANSPTDDYKTALNKLKSNRFSRGQKVAIAIGNNADKNILKEFTGNMEAVLDSHQADLLRKIFRLREYHIEGSVKDDIDDDLIPKAKFLKPITKESDNTYEYIVLTMNAGKDELDEYKKTLEADLDVFEESGYALKKTVAIQNQIVIILQKEIKENNTDHWD